MNPHDANCAVVSAAYIPVLRVAGLVLRLDALDERSQSMLSLEPMPNVSLCRFLGTMTARKDCQL